MNKVNYIIIICSAFLLLASCDKAMDEPKNVKITLSFSNQVNGEPLELNTSKKYKNDHGEEFKIEKFKYYISNIQLRNKKSGAYYIEPESYHLVSPGQNSSIFNIELELPSAEYDLLEFAVGVDQEKNTSLSYDGDLDPNNSMAWDWDSGYKFLILEGKYFTSTTGSNGGGLVFHIGENKNYKKVVLPLPVETIVNTHKTLSIKVAIEEMWKTPHQIVFDELNEAMSGEAATEIAENYADGMFSIESFK